ncbi:hypothetical protein BU25DRAFT_495130 [Macroventuria anomochaeta]|uniref:Uncharacterized protein n=1 Tax=Macroventuria anomochaeta TaxID=301207 RepID=A0ACB6RL02_9PLEO|nr:uncharacterized protein BU25DRAFT_495130 [Macroventuria anomochaeta]KAF2622408.1 hypothetical protein BU25DRAFT_495130 [Macroventuria anomochaeta]
MAVTKHPITHHWIKQTLVPFLLYAFASSLPYPADISVQIQRSVDFCFQKPDHPSDGDDLVFERIFMAIMHRYKDLAPDLEMVVDNLEPLAKYLIRRAQLKGPYELLGRPDIGSGAWVKHERVRLSRLALEPEEVKDELRPPVRPPSIPTRQPPAEEDIDPRLVHAQPGHFAAAALSTQLTAEEDSHYRRQNREFEQYHSRRQQQQMYSAATPIQTISSSYTLPGRGPTSAPILFGSLYQRQQQQSQQMLTAASVYTQQQAQQQVTSLLHANPNTQTHPQMQMSQPSTSTFTGGRSAQPYATEQRLSPQPQSAQYPSTQYQPAQYQMARRSEVQQQPAQPTQSTRQYTQPSTQLSRIPFPPKPSLPPQPSPALGQQTHTISSSDFAHLRGTDWSNAAQQRAREIAAKVTAQERDMMAQSIMQRQHSIAQAPTAIVSGKVMYSPTKSAQDTRARPQSAMGYCGASFEPANGGHGATTAGSGLGMALPSNGERAGLPTLEQVRSRYYSSQQQQQQQQQQTSAQYSAMPPPQWQLYSPFMSERPPATAPQHTLGQQMQPLLPLMNGVQVDALQQLQHAACSSDGTSAQSWLDSGLSMPLTGAGETWLKSEEDGGVRMDGMET